MAVYNGKLYVIGGRDIPLDGFKDLQLYKRKHMKCTDTAFLVETVYTTQRRGNMILKLMSGWNCPIYRESLLPMPSQ